MTLEEFREKYGTETVGLIIDALVFRILTKGGLSEYDRRQVAELKSDISKLLKGE